METFINDITEIRGGGVGDIVKQQNTEPLYHSFMYSFVSLLSGIYTLPAMHSLLVTILLTLTSWGIGHRSNFLP